MRQNADKLAEIIEQIQTKLEDFKIQIEELKDQINQEEAQQEAKRPLAIGDTVRILNSVRLGGEIRRKDGVKGKIVRFTDKFVIVRVRRSAKKKNG